MIEKQLNNPLHGVKLEALLTELVEHYGFEILAVQININCFKTNPSITSSLKFLRRTPWARNKVEAFYLYKYLQLPRPNDQEHLLPPRDRPIPLDQQSQAPAAIAVDAQEFFDDPLSGPKPFAKAGRGRDSESDAHKTTAPARRKSTGSGAERPAGIGRSSNDQLPTPDPWANWRAKNKPKDDH